MVPSWSTAGDEIVATAIPTRRQHRRAGPNRSTRRPAPRPALAPPRVGRFAPTTVRLPDARTRRATDGCIADIGRCQTAFDMTPGVLGARGQDAGPAIDRPTRAAREQSVDLAVAALNGAETARRLLGVAQRAAGTSAGARAPEEERAAKSAMLNHFRKAGRRAAARAGQGRVRAEAVTLRVRPASLTAAGRAALAVLLQEAGVHMDG